MFRPTEKQKNLILGFFALLALLAIAGIVITALLQLFIITGILALLAVLVATATIFVGFFPTNGKNIGYADLPINKTERTVPSTSNKTENTGPVYSRTLTNTKRCIEKYFQGVFSGDIVAFQLPETKKLGYYYSRRYFLRGVAHSLEECDDDYDVSLTSYDIYDNQIKFCDLSQANELAIIDCISNKKIDEIFQIYGYICLSYNKLRTQKAFHDAMQPFGISEEYYSQFNVLLIKLKSTGFNIADDDQLLKKILNLNTVDLTNKSVKTVIFNTETAKATVTFIDNDSVQEIDLVSQNKVTDFRPTEKILPASASKTH